MILFRQCEIFAPEVLGIKDVLVAGQKIVAISDHIEIPSGIDVEVINCSGLRMIPGLIDAHVHIAGAGGEGGPATRTPEIQLSQLLEAGVTTVIGCLGTDGLTRSVESVLMKAKGLRQEGVSAWIYTGSYQVPVTTILGDVGKDIAMIDEVIGTGEIAISDHRSSAPSVNELIRIAAHSRVGGMLGGKAGIVNIHMGDAEHPFQPIYDAVAQSELNFKQFLPTHCNRNHYIFEEAKEYGKKGYVDITASSYPFFPQYEIKPSKAIKELVSAGVPIEHITMSSDGCGSLPSFNENGDIERLEMGYPMSVYTELSDLVNEEGMSLEVAVKVLTSNIADILKLWQKGRIQIAKDADLVILNADFVIHHVVAMGKLMVKDGISLKKGNYEK
ncbi:MAG: beta-aspartyl-peptidase [Prolixibacteraceae bacterium]|nr:beta-aspartyl-peptidase [Prolixibacteraceae bacterium]